MPSSRARTGRCLAPLTLLPLLLRLEMYREIRDNMVAAVRGPKYHNNLLGEGLYDQLRMATSKASGHGGDQASICMRSAVHAYAQNRRGVGIGAHL